MDEKLTETIINLCILINKKLETDSYIDWQEISETTKALAELVTAKANVTAIQSSFADKDSTNVL